LANQIVTRISGNIQVIQQAVELHLKQYMEIQQAELVIMRNEELLKDILQGIQLNKIEIKKLDEETN
jgi:hypothetical protein